MGLRSAEGVTLAPVMNGGHRPPAIASPTPHTGVMPSLEAREGLCVP